MHMIYTEIVKITFLIEMMTMLIMCIDFCNSVYQRHDDIEGRFFFSHSSIRSTVKIYC